MSDINDYENCESRLMWKCHDPSHPSWSGTYHALVLQKRWCRACKYKKHGEEISIRNGYTYNMEYIQEFAAERGGQCLSTEYKNSKTPLIWKCHNPRHEPWKAKFNTLKSQNTWCSECHREKKLIGLNKPLRLKEAQELAKSRGGLCLSEVFINIEEKLKWKCDNPEHRPWEAAFKSIKNKEQWCPQCAGQRNKTENRVRYFLEEGLGFKLDPIRADWNRNPLTNKKLELDGYNEEHKFAFEHDGEHHFKKNVTHYSADNDKFLTQAYRDKVKKENCLKRGIKLINIPILKPKSRYKFFPLLRHVIKECRKQDVELKYTYSQIKQMKNNFKI